MLHDKIPPCVEGQQEQTAVILRFPRRRRRKSQVRRNKKLARILFMPKGKGVEPCPLEN
jgi:hypothetical protein